MSDTNQRVFRRKWTEEEIIAVILQGLKQALEQHLKVKTNEIHISGRSEKAVYEQWKKVVEVIYTWHPAHGIPALVAMLKKKKTGDGMPKKNTSNTRKDNADEEWVDVENDQEEEE